MIKNEKDFEEISKTIDSVGSGCAWIILIGIIITFTICLI